MAGIRWLACPDEGAFAVVQLIVTADAQQCELVDVGLALGGCVERHHVVGLAEAGRAAAENAAVISCDKRSELGWRGETALTAMPKNFAPFIEYGATDDASACVAFENGVWEVAGAVGARGTDLRFGIGVDHDVDVHHRSRVGRARR